MPILKFLESRCWGMAVLVAALVLPAFSPRAQAAFHLWNLSEIYSNSSGSLQFIELSCAVGGQTVLVGQTVNVSNVGATQTNTIALPSNVSGSTAGKTYLIGTAGIQAAGAPAPDVIVPNGFLFAAGGSINFFGTNSGAYTAIPTNGSLARIWTGGDALNSPMNYAGQSGTIVIPEPATLGIAAAACLLRRRRGAAL